MEIRLKALGIVGSPRNGNSLYLMEQAFAAMNGYNGSLPITVHAELYLFRQGRIAHCLACGACAKNGRCAISDDFQALFQKWVEADLVLYSVPVYHLGVPSQLKAFFDRLGNTLRPFFSLSSPKHLKVIGGIVQGRHLFAGEELTLSYLLQHAVLLNSLPVPGDRWESYLGAAGWTGNSGDRNALAGLSASGNEDALAAVKAAGTLAVRALELAFILKTGVSSLQKHLEKDESYRPALSRLPGTGEADGG